MKQLFKWLILLLISSLMACQETTTKPPVSASGKLEFQFDLDSKLVKVKPQTKARAVQSNLTFDPPATFDLIADASKHVNYLSATVKVNNLTASSLSDLTLIAYYKSGNDANSALNNILDANGAPLNAAQLEHFARGVKPTTPPSALTPNFLTNNAIADLQIFQESELTSLETAATGANELNADEYLFPYGFVARAGGNSRSLGAGDNAGSITISLQIPDGSKPSFGNPRRFGITFLVFDQPVTPRVSESFEERHSSGVYARGAAFGLAVEAIAQILPTTTIPSNPTLRINGLRTAGSASGFKTLLGERATTIGSAANDQGTSVAVDSGGNVFVAGFTAGGLDGNPNAGQQDLILIKYDQNGVKRWTRQFGTTSLDKALGVALDASGNAFVTGITGGKLDGNTGAGGSDGFLIKYDTNGAKKWTQLIGSSGNEQALGIGIDPKGNALIAGNTTGVLDGISNLGFTDIFVAKYNTDGTRLWVRQLGTAGSESATGVAMDSSGNAFVTGFTSGSLDGNTQAGNGAFLVKYDPAGQKLWTRQLGGNKNDVSTSIAVDSGGNAFIAGHTYGALNGSPSAGSIFLAKYDTDGAPQWTRLLTPGGALSNAQAQGVAIDSSGNALVTGWTSGGLDKELFNGEEDIFLVKYDSGGVKQQTREIGTGNFDFAYGIALDSSDNAFVAGYSNSGWAGAPNSTVVTDPNDLLLVRFDALAIY